MSALVVNTLVDPYNITDYTRSDEQLQALFLFCTAVAGKKAKMIAPKIEEFLNGISGHGTPFEKITDIAAQGTLDAHLRRVALGKYGLLSRAYRDVASRPPEFLRTATVDELETIPGVGLKTARFFVVHSRAGVQHAVIDTHMLKFLRYAGEKDVPSGNSPKRHEYPRLEKAVLAHVSRAGMEPAAFDLRVWTWYEAGNRSLPDFLQSYEDR